jgi:L-alanine-DL-glutamate epimerase-like enolase superfamily enzyme
MKITGADLLPLRLPSKADGTGFGSDAPLEGEPDLTPEQLALRRYTPPEIALLRLKTDVGLEGLGEAATLPHYLNMPLGGLLDWLRRLLPQIVGHDPRDLVGLHRRMEQVAGFAAPGCHPARAAIDMAAHDLLGKAAGCPVYTLLGGAYRTTFELQTQMHGFTPEQQLAVGRY